MTGQAERLNVVTYICRGISLADACGVTQDSGYLSKKNVNP